MTIVLTEQIKLLASKESTQAFQDVCERYTMAATEVSQVYFEAGMNCTKRELHDSVYQPIRMAYGLKSQMAESVVGAVLARYKSVDEQMKQTTAKYKDENDGKHYAYRRNKRWLQQPIVFHRPQADLVRGRDWSFRSGMTKISINTLDKRVVCNFQCRKSSRIFDPDWTQGGAKLVFHESDKHWYLHISVSRHFDDTTKEDIKGVCGHDRGLINLTATCHADDSVTYEDGAHIAEVRNRYACTRASLQKKGTKGAKRVLKRISGRENRMMSDVNHRISKTLATGCNANTLHVLEDLTGISFDEHNLHNRNAEGRNSLRSWSFYDLEQKLAYKVAMRSGMVIKVDPQYTSQRCPACGNIDKSARNREKHLYACTKCGKTFNDDEAASRNLKALGIQFLEGVEKPHFAKS